jgi:RNA polymerase sigma factor
VSPDLDQDNVTSWLNSAASGNDQARGKLIEYYQPFILNEAQQVCHRSLQWGRDDEHSIALLAFNEAIDAYKKSKGGSFNLLCRLVIKRRLIDYFRKAGKLDNIPDSDKLISKVIFDEDWERSEREAEIEKYKLILNDFNLRFDKVAKAQPKHNQTREKLRRAAKALAEDRELIDYLRKSGNLPKRRLCELAGVTPRMLDRGRVYVIALALLLAGDDLPHLQSYARELVGKGDN